MKAEFINPFLESARIVIEQVVQVRPATGTLGIRELTYIEDYIWIHIGMSGQVSGNVIFGLNESVALKMVSAMMGGFMVTELDEMGHSAISELGNMISGNASTILYNQGVRVDITPPKVLKSTEGDVNSAKALTVPLIMDGIGELDIQVLIS
ncbi:MULTISPECIES: chemotaxis protein CheX [unclassified Paenibacillus]|uniref:chemotaxis protein CheX n=1 Tax=unclassified Paenibacillus TaxID=185978 RepID=UPI001C0F6FEA|nr:MULTISPECIES: chemotaxis protein CheX [unclassified Paenibacillus]MBU5440883.1 chemotaxis protein CheX [Paenibacillus sp. MSJ-34]CAH0118417.1 CheY-P phosphatase CheX [Paenibacillus sp. CECT 9249]